MEIAETLSRLTSLRASHQLRYGHEQCFSFAATLRPAPTAEEWIWSHDNQAKLGYIAGHGGNLPLWWARFSFVFPVWYQYFNVWSPRASDPKYLGANFTEQAPDSEWESTLIIAERAIAGHGFSTLPSAEFFRRVEFVRYLVFSDDDEPRLETCTVAQCLFLE